MMPSIAIEREAKMMYVDLIKLSAQTAAEAVVQGNPGADPNNGKGSTTRRRCRMSSECREVA